MSQSYLEQNASNFWCPHTRVATIISAERGVTEQVVAVNRNPDRSLMYEHSNCIGSRCANWTWDSPQQKGPNEEGHCGLSNS